MHGLRRGPDGWPRPVVARLRIALETQRVFAEKPHQKTDEEDREVEHKRITRRLATLHRSNPSSSQKWLTGAKTFDLTTARTKNATPASHQAPPLITMSELESAD